MTVLLTTTFGAAPLPPPSTNNQPTTRTIMKPLLHSLALAAGLCVVALNAAAGQYSIDWFTIDGGGGTSTGGVYSVSGTVGQPDTASASGGSFKVTGGFWSIFAVPEPGVPRLSIVRSGTNAVISWPKPSNG